MNQTLNVSNFKRVVRQLIQPHKELINDAAEHFKNKISEYRSSQLLRKTSRLQTVLTSVRRSSSNVSQISADVEAQEVKEVKVIPQSIKPKKYQLKEWESSVKPAFGNYSNLTKYYEQLFFAKKCMRKSTKDFYDFKVDEKEMLTKIFNQIKTEENAIEFKAIINFFNECKLFYLCYNIKPSHLEDVLKDSAHQFSNKLTLLEFLNVFFIDRPNLITLNDNESIKVAKRCILNQQSWKQLKFIFSSLDTFGNQTIFMAPFLFKIKNNPSNRQLINEPTIEYPEINRTLPMKKIIFNLENRYKFTDKISWPEIEKIIKDFKYEANPTIDIIYKRLIQRGKISKFSNYFMIDDNIIQEIKHIFNRCPKYCEYFIKTRFLLNELLESSKIKNVMRQSVVRVIQNGNKDIPITLEDQIRLISKNAQSYIDLDELLEYFTIKGPINTQADVEICVSDADSQIEQQRIDKLRHARSADRIQQLKKSGKYVRPVRHLTICQQFKLSSQQKETTMQRRTRQWKQAKQKQIEMECKKKFKANPIPAQLNPERYKQYVKQIQEAKIIRHEQFYQTKEKQKQVYHYLKSNTNLFVKKERVKTEPKQQYKFTHKSVPWHVVETNLLQNINNQKMLRKKNIFTKNKMRILKQWKKLPDVMQDHQKLTDKDSLDSKSDNRMSLEVEQKTIPKRQVRQVPDFKRLHLQFEEQLNQKKQKFIPTVPISPKFTQIKKRQQKMESKKVSRIKSAENLRHLQMSAQHKTSVQTCIAKQQIQIPMTKKFLGMVEFTQEKLQQKQLERIRLEEVQRQRQNKQYNFAKFMQKKLKQSLHKTVSLTQLTKAKAKKLHEDWKRLKKQNQEQMYQMYSKVMARPFLFESNQSQQNQNVPKVTKSSLAKNITKPIWKNERQGKHVHQSPLKQIDPQQDSPNKPEEKHQMEFQPESQSELSRNKAYLLNQSF